MHQTRSHSYLTQQRNLRSSMCQLNTASLTPSLKQRAHQCSYPLYQLWQSEGALSLLSCHCSLWINENSLSNKTCLFFSSQNKQACILTKRHQTRRETDWNMFHYTPRYTCDCSCNCGQTGSHCQRWKWVTVFWKNSKMSSKSAFGSRAQSAQWKNRCGSIAHTQRCGFLLDILPKQSHQHWAHPYFCSVQVPAVSPC